MCKTWVFTNAPMYFADNVLTVGPNANSTIPVDLVELSLSIWYKELYNPLTINEFKAIWSPQLISARAQIKSQFKPFYFDRLSWARSQSKCWICGYNYLFLLWVVEWKNLDRTMRKNNVIDTLFKADMMVSFWLRYEVKSKQHVCIEPGVINMIFLKKWGAKLSFYQRLLTNFLPKSVV